MSSLQQFVREPTKYGKEKVSEEKEIFKSNNLKDFAKGPEYTEQPKHAENPSDNVLEQESVDFDDDEQITRDIERAIARMQSRMIERVIGLPGDLKKLGEKGAAAILGTETPEEMGLTSFLPTSGELQKTSEELSGGYTKPQNAFEQSMDDLAGNTATSFIGPSNTATVFRTIAVPLAGSLGKEFLKNSGVDEKNASYGSMAMMMAMDLLNSRQTVGGGGVRRFAGALSNLSEQMAPQNVSMNTRSMLQNARALRQRITAGGSAPSKTAPLSKLDELITSLETGNFSPHEGVRTIRATNETIENLGGFNLGQSLNPRTKRTATGYMQDINNVVRDGITEWGQRNNPMFLEVFNRGNEAFAAYAGGNVVKNFLQKNFGDKIQSDAMKTLFGLSNVGLKTASMYYFPWQTAVGLMAYEGIKLVNRIGRSPTLARYYANIVNGAMSGNISKTASNIDALQHKLKKEEEASVLD